MLRLPVAIYGSSPAHRPVETVKNQGMGGVRVANLGSTDIVSLLFAGEIGETLDFRAVQGSTRQIVHPVEVVKRGQCFMSHSVQAYRAPSRQAMENQACSLCKTRQADYGEIGRRQAAPLFGDRSESRKLVE